MLKKCALALSFAILCVNASASQTDVDAVNDAMQRLNAAMIAGDAQQMKALTDDNLSYGHSSGRVQGQQAFIQTIAGGETRYRRIDLSNSTTTVVGDNAVIRDHFSGTTESAAGKQTDVDFDVLLVWQKEGGAWKLLARQGYKH